MHANQVAKVHDQLKAYLQNNTVNNVSKLSLPRFSVGPTDSLQQGA